MDSRKYAIYCYADSYQEIEKQKEECLHTIKSKFNIDDNAIIVYSDLKSNERKDLNRLLDDISKDEIQLCTSISMDRVSRNINKILDIQTLLDRNHSDFYFLHSDNFLVKNLDTFLYVLKQQTDYWQELGNTLDIEEDIDYDFEY